MQMQMMMVMIKPRVIAPMPSLILPSFTESSQTSSQEINGEFDGQAVHDLLRRYGDPFSDFFCLELFRFVVDYQNKFLFLFLLKMEISR